MNHDSSTTWHQTLQDDPMLATDDDDFTNFLRLGIDFPDFDQSNAATNGFDTPMGDLGIDQLAMSVSAEELASTVMQPVDITSLNTHVLPLSRTSRGAHSVPATPHPTHQQNTFLSEMQKSQYQSRIMVPPTPKSSELAGSATTYYHIMDDGTFPHTDGFVDFRGDRMTFTPLVSPAVTPVDPNLQLTEASTSGEYFSPLNSPALEAQDVISRRRTFPQGTLVTGSPIVDATPARQPNGRTIRAATRKSGRKNSVSEKSSGRRASQSNISRPEARWKQASMRLSTNGIAKSNQTGPSPKSATSPARQGLYSSSDGSGQSSISPEPLSESLMPPPSLPRSAGRSPNLLASNQSSNHSSEAVTPATLMRLQNQKASPQLGSHGCNLAFSGHEFLEEIMLPESATTSDLPHLTLDTRENILDGETTPTLSAKTPKLSVNSTPRTSSTKLQAKSPTTSSHRRGESRSSSTGKARQSNNMPHISPAIRPKISPVIKPLIPNSTPGTPSISAETSALYLASKSNYQNILEGTHLPGVSYPEALAENLSSKRTSHKLAEQGRRNRINVALKEMESLLPQLPAAKAKRERSGSCDADSGDKSGGSSNSKASTVELAISYIKALQAELSTTRTKLAEAETKLAKEVGAEFHGVGVEPTL